MTRLPDDRIDESPISQSSSHPVIRSSILSVSSLSLHHFRNYRALRLAVGPGPVLLAGPNGAGKTNILEALSLLSPGRGLRRAKLGEMNFLSPATNNQQLTTGWAIAATVHGMQGEAQLGTGLDAESATDRRMVKIDGKPCGQQQLASHLSMLWLTPQMEQLFLDGASAGRKFFDRLVYAFDPGHAARVTEYEFAMRERNRLLAQPGRPDEPWIDALERSMAETACAIAASRLQAAATLNQAIQASPLGFPKAEVQMRGFCEDLLLAGRDAAGVEDALAATLASGRMADAGAGRALAGAHRSELHVFHPRHRLPAGQCSTGEQKALLLSMVLAQARAISQQKRVVPMLLLDEVVAHLDAARKLELFEEVCQTRAQVWMTGTDAAIFDGLEKKAQRLQVENGNVF